MHKVEPVDGIAKPMPSKEYLNSILGYEPDTGKLFWKNRTMGDSRYTRCGVAYFNNNHAGTEAFTFTSRSGYKVGKVNGGLWQAHRVIWTMVYGSPDGYQIDHIDRNRTNNQILNLRLADARLNALNRNTCRVTVTISPEVE